MRKQTLQNNKKKSWLLSLLFAYIFIGNTNQAYANELYLTGKFGTYGFSVENNGSSSLSGLGAYSLDLGYRLSNTLTASLVFNALAESVISGDMGYGFDIALRHYPISNNGVKKLSDDKINIHIADLYRPYYGFAFRQREFILILSTSYVGPGFFAGIDYQWSPEWFLNFEFRYDMLQGPGEATATQMNLLFGFGKEF
jgi:hypothetical protein